MERKKKKLANSVLGGGIKTSNAFTLIELLAIIVILVIIAVITVPIILNVIDNSKKGAIKDSAYGYKDAINKYYVSELYENPNLKLNGTYTITDNGELSDGTNVYEIPFTGTIPTGGNLTYENNVLKDGCITIDEYKVAIEDGEVTTTEKGTCESISLTACDSLNFDPSPESWFAYEKDEDTKAITITGFSESWNGTTDITIPCQIGEDAVISIGANAFNSKNLTQVILNNNILHIETGAFYGNKLINIEIPNSVLTIGDGAFVSNNLETFEIPDSVIEFDKTALMGNSNLKHVTIGNGISEIEVGLFAEYNLETVTLGKNVKIIGAGAFNNNKLTSITIPEGVVSIGNDAFAGNEIVGLIIPEGVVSIGTSAFANNKIESLEIPNSVTDIDWSTAFLGNDIKSLKINTTNIGVGVFDSSHGYSLTNVEIGEKVETIGSGAFFGNRLEEVTISDNVTEIGAAAFLKNTMSNFDLSLIYNNTGKSFDWELIINGTSEGKKYETGTVKNQYGDVEIKKSN